MPQSTQVIHNVQWTIDNKYYTANIEFMMIQHSPQLLKQLNWLKNANWKDTCEAVIVHSRHTVICHYSETIFIFQFQFKKPALRCLQNVCLRTPTACKAFDFITFK